MAANNKSSRNRNFRNTALVILAIIGIFVAAVFVYQIFIKDSVTRISAEKISELINMEVTFDSYEVFDGNSIEITGLVIKSPYLLEDYKTVNTHHADWIRASISRIRLDKFDYERLIEDKEFSASLITIDSAMVRVYRDKTLPDPPYKYKPLPASLLRKIEASVNVDTLILNRVNIQYEERTKHSSQPGKITIENLSAKCFHLTNDSARLAVDPYFTVDAKSTVLKEADVQANIRFDLTSMQDEFQMSATVGAFNAIVLNNIITGVLPAKITDGKVKGINMEFDGNDDRAVGTIDFQYEEMKFDLLGDDQSKFKSWLATAAGKAVVRKDNLQTNNNYQKGTISFDRRKDRFIFNYWWNSLKSGVVDVMMSDTGKMFNLDEKAKETK